MSDGRVKHEIHDEPTPVTGLLQSQAARWREWVKVVSGVLTVLGVVGGWIWAHTARAADVASLKAQQVDTRREVDGVRFELEAVRVEVSGLRGEMRGLLTQIQVDHRHQDERIESVAERVHARLTKH